MRARDVMSDGVLSVACDATVLEAANLLVNCRVSAMPVVDANGVVVGIVSEADLVQPKPGENPDDSLLARIAEDPQAAGAHVSSAQRKVTDVMTRDVVSAGEDTPLPELARLMMDRGVKRLAILRGGAVVGMVSRRDLLRAAIALQSGHDEAKFSRDEQLRGEVTAACRGRSWSQARQLDVVVNRGVAHLWGTVPSENVRQAYQAAAENVPGVRAVEVHMHISAPTLVRVGL